MIVREANVIESVDSVSAGLEPSFPEGFVGNSFAASPEGIITIELIDGVTDYAAIINAALREPDVVEVRLGEGTFPVSVPVVLPSNAYLTGASRDGTIIQARADFYGGDGTSGVVQSELRATDVTVSDFFIDVNRVLPNGLRVNGLFLNQVDGFDVSRVDVANATGYAHFAVGDISGLINNNPDAQGTTGSYSDIWTYNSQVHYEVMAGDGVTYTNVHARDGDGDIETEAYFHPLNGSRNITYIDSSAIGAGFLGFSMISTTRAAENISIINTYVEVYHPSTGYGLINHGSLPTTNLIVENSTFISHNYMGFSVINTSGSITNSTFQGGVFGMAVENYNDGDPYQLIASDSLALALSSPNRRIGIAGLDATEGLVWIRGEIEARGSGELMIPVSGTGEVSPETILIKEGHHTRVGFNGIGADTILFPQVALPSAGFGSFGGGSVVAAFQAHHLASDRLEIVAGGVPGISIAGNDILFEGIVIGTTSGGFDGVNLVVSLAEAATAAAVQALVQSIAYSSGGEDPGTRSRLIEIDIIDAAGVIGDLNAAVHMSQMLGGFERDLYIVGNAATQITEQANSGIDEVRTSLSQYVLPANIEQLTYLGDDAAQLRGNAANNLITGGDNGNLIDMRDGGDDVAIGGAGEDGFYFGAAYTRFDVVDGGAGDRDQLGLQGNYSASTMLGAMTGIETIVLLNGADNRFNGATGTNLSYNLRATEATVSAGGMLAIQGNMLRAGEHLTFNGAAETDGSFLVYGGLGNDVLTGGSGNDGFFFGQGRFGSGDVVNGGGGSDQLGFQGNFIGGNSLVFRPNQLSGIEYIVLLSASDDRFGASGGVANYVLHMDNGNVAAGQRLIISATTLQAGERLQFFGTREMDGSFLVYSGAGDDLLTGGERADELVGGAGNDVLYGRGGADILRGGSGNDQFRYGRASESTAAARDNIRDFAAGDTIHLLDLASNNGLASFTFIGAGAPTGAGQIQVVQNGNLATVNIFINGDSVADTVIDVTLVGGHVLTAADFVGISGGGQNEWLSSQAASPEPTPEWHLPADDIGQGGGTLELVTSFLGRNASAGGEWFNSNTAHFGDLTETSVLSDSGLFGGLQYRQIGVLTNDFLI